MTVLKGKKKKSNTIHFSCKHYLLLMIVDSYCLKSWIKQKRLFILLRWQKVTDQNTLRRSCDYNIHQGDSLTLSFPKKFRIILSEGSCRNNKPEDIKVYLMKSFACSKHCFIARIKYVIKSTWMLDVCRAGQFWQTVTVKWEVPLKFLSPALERQPFQCLTWINKGRFFIKTAFYWFWSKNTVGLSWRLSWYKTRMFGPLKVFFLCIKLHFKTTVHYLLLK